MTTWSNLETNSELIWGNGDNLGTICTLLGNYLLGTPWELLRDYLGTICTLLRVYFLDTICTLLGIYFLGDFLGTICTLLAQVLGSTRWGHHGH